MMLWLPPPVPQGHCPPVGLIQATRALGPDQAQWLPIYSHYVVRNHNICSHKTTSHGAIGVCAQQSLYTDVPREGNSLTLPFSFFELQKRASTKDYLDYRPFKTLARAILGGCLPWAQSFEPKGGSNRHNSQQSF